MRYKQKHPALLERKCEKCGVLFWITSQQLAKKRCGSFKEKTGCAAEIGRLAQQRYRKNNPDKVAPDTQAFNKRREIERAQAKLQKYVARYGKDVITNWINN